MLFQVRIQSCLRAEAQFTKLTIRPVTPKWSIVCPEMHFSIFDGLETASEIWASKTVAFEWSRTVYLLDFIALAILSMIRSVTEQRLKELRESYLRQADCEWILIDPFISY